MPFNQSQIKSMHDFVKDARSKYLWTGWKTFEDPNKMWLGIDERTQKITEYQRINSAWNIISSQIGEVQKRLFFDFSTYKHSFYVLMKNVTRLGMKTKCFCHSLISWHASFCNNQTCKLSHSGGGWSEGAKKEKALFPFPPTCKFLYMKLLFIFSDGHENIDLQKVWKEKEPKKKWKKDL